MTLGECITNIAHSWLEGRTWVGFENEGWGGPEIILSARCLVSKAQAEEESNGPNIHLRPQQ